MAEVNLDIALETTSQEILSKVGTSETTSQEILEKIGNVEKKDFKYIAYSGKASTHTPVSITGKGRLYYAYCYVSTASSGTSATTITVDGEKILNHSYTTSTSTTKRTSVENPLYIIENGGNSGGGAYFFGNGIVNMTGTSETPVSLSKGSTHSPTVATTSCYINGYIEFNESLTIKMTGAHSSNICNAYLCYSLEE